MTLSVPRSTLRNTYGWDVELTCAQCRFTGMPRYEGWSHGLKTDAGGDAAVYAKVACTQCGRRLTDEAAGKLVDLFAGIDTPDRNRKLISRFAIQLVLVPFVLAFVLFFGTQMDWWGWGLGTVWVLLASAVSIPALATLKNNGVADLLLHCECGKPHYVFMGTLDGCSCYRCFSCGTLMKLRE
ncbi:MAG TPA: hypothetical protein VL197_08875 [Nitrospirota bacterium]|nr:hypothetical protein [Nitrospirota bacterium]